MSKPPEIVALRQRPTIGDNEKPARGLLRRALTLEAVELVRLAPSTDLESIVEHFWLILWDRADRPAYHQENLPHPSQHLVLDPQGRTGIFGLMREKFTYDLASSGRVIGLKFRPGMFAGFLGRPVNEITDTVQPIAATFGVADADLIEQFRQLNDPADMAAPLEDLLRIHLPAPDPRSETARDTVALIAERPEIRSVAGLAKITGISARSLQRLFDAYVGAGHKWVIDRYRMIEAVEALNRGEERSLTALAHDLGYFDQAHFSKAFTALTGRPPSDYRT
jgi:AraC-like DNA-binding protein